MKTFTILAMLGLGLTIASCAGGNGKVRVPIEFSINGTPVSKDTLASATPYAPLALGQVARLPSTEGLTMTVLSLVAGRCDNGAALLVEAELGNETDKYSRAIPTIVIRSPDNQELVNFMMFDDHPNFYNLPQGLPPHSKTRAFYCAATDGHSGRGRLVGDIPATFSGWVVESQPGPLWRVD